MNNKNTDSNIPEYSYVEDQKTVQNSFINHDSSFITVTQKVEIPDSIPYKVLKKDSQNSYEVIFPFGTVISNEQQIKTAKKPFTHAIIEQSYDKKTPLDQKKQYFPMKRFYNGLGRIKPELLNNKILDKIYSKKQIESQKKFEFTDVSSQEYKNSIPGNSNQAFTRRQITFSQQSKISGFKHRSFAQRPTGPTSSLLSDSAQEFVGYNSRAQAQRRQQFQQNYPVTDKDQQNYNQSHVFIQQRNSEPRNEYTTVRNFKFNENRTSLPRINQNIPRNALTTVVSKLPEGANLVNIQEDYKFSNNISSKDQDSNLITNNSQFSISKNKEHRTISTYVANQRQVQDNTHSRQFESVANHYIKQSEPALESFFQQNPKDNSITDIQEEKIYNDQDIILKMDPIRFINKFKQQNSGQVGSLSVKVSQRKILKQKTEKSENRFNSFFVKVSLGSRKFNSYEKDIDIQQNESVSFPISYYGKDKDTIQIKQKEKKIKNINSLENMPELVDEAAISAIIKKVENLPKYLSPHDKQIYKSVDQREFGLHRNSIQENKQISDKEYFKKLMALLPQKDSQFFKVQNEVCRNWNQFENMPQQFWDDFTNLQNRKRKLDMNQELRNEMKDYALQRSQSVPRLYTKLQEPIIQTENSTRMDKIDVTINQRDLGRIRSEGDFFRSKIRSQADILHINTFINFSSGNQYDEQQNQKLKKAVNKIQNDISNLDTFINQKEEKVGEIFKQMKILKSKIIKTQLEGEKQGHCKGIQKKLDPIQKYKIIQDIGKHMRDQEEIREKNKAKKGIRQAQKQEEKKQRVLSNMTQKQIQKMLNCTSSINQFLPQNKKQIQLALMKSPAHQITNLGLQTQRESILHKKRIQKNSSNPTSPLQVEKKSTMNLQQNCQTFSSEIAEKRFKILRNALQFQQRWLKDYQPFDLLLSSKQLGTQREKNIQSCLHTLIHHFETMGFGPGKPKGLLNANNQNKACPILNDPNALGLIQIPQFTKFFMSLCEEQVSIKNCRLRRQSLKDYLGIRYSARIADKILLFLENQFQSLYRINMEAYCKLIMDIMNAGPEFYKKLLFACLSFQNPGRICEHDLFNLLSQFQQADPFHFYKQLIGKEDVPRDYLQIYDTSDRIFFEAFSPDFKVIAEQFEFRSKLQDIEENEKEQAANKFKPDTKLNLNLIGKDYLQRTDDKNKQNVETQNNNDKILNIVNQIQYAAQIITNKGTSETFCQNLFEILQHSQSLEELHFGLINIIAENKLVQKRDKKPGDSSDMNDKKINNGENGSRNAAQQSGISFLKPPTNIIPCLGHGINSLTGKKISNCIYMNYEDFNKLIQFPKSQVSSFVEDLVDHMTCGLISLHSFEFYFHKYRTIANHNGFQQQNLLDFIKDRNTQIFGNPRGELSNAMIAKKSRQGLLEYQSFKHEVKQKFIVQDHYNNDEFSGKLMICNVINNTTNNNQKKKQKKDKKSTMFAPDIILGKKLNQIENKAQDEILHTDPDSLIDYGDQESKEIDEGDELQQSDEEQEIKNRNKPIINLVDKKEVEELINMRSNFGNINFFRIFRIFYKLAVIPRDANNNPMAPYIDKKSIIRNFHKVFNIENEEIAVRFYSLFKYTEPVEELVKDENKIKNSEIGIVQFMKVIWQLVNLGDNKHIQMAFKFLDYHNFNKLGSVDVMAITKSFDAQLFDDIKVNFKNKDNNN